MNELWKEIIELVTLNMWISLHIFSKKVSKMLDLNDTNLDKWMSLKFETEKD